MPEVFGIEKLFSVLPRKRFGHFRLYGTSQYGHSNYGESDIFYLRTGYGDASFGVDSYGDLILLSGIYRTDNVTGRTKFYREPYYIPKNPRFEPQQAWRGKFDAGVAAWQGLTPEQKAVYNQKAIGKQMSGYNFFLREYMNG